MPSPYIFTEDDLEIDTVEYLIGDLPWRWDTTTSNTYTASVTLNEGDTAPLNVEGPCFALYHREGLNGEPSVTTSPLS